MVPALFLAGTAAGQTDERWRRKRSGHITEDHLDLDREDQAFKADGLSDPQLSYQVRFLN